MRSEETVSDDTSSNVYAELLLIVAHSMRIFIRPHVDFMVIEEYFSDDQSFIGEQDKF